jgi:hypothetical protein
MPSAYNWHPEFGYLCPSPILRRKAGFALPFVAFGAIAAASTMVVQMSDHTPMTDGRSTVAAIHVSDPPAAPVVSRPAIVESATPPEPAIPVIPAASPASIAEAAPSHLQGSATQTDSAQAVAPPEVVTTKPSRQRVASRKSTGSTQTRRRHRGWYDAYAWRPAYYGRGSVYERSN